MFAIAFDMDVWSTPPHCRRGCPIIYDAVVADDAPEVPSGIIGRELADEGDGWVWVVVVGGWVGGWADIENGRGRR